MQRILVLALIGATLLAGCQLSASPPPTPTTSAVLAPVNPGAVTISFAAPEHERSFYLQLAQQFMAENTDINVVVLALDALRMTDNPSRDTPFTQARRIVSGADTLPSIEIPPALYGSDLLLNLAPLLAADPTAPADDFYPGALAFHQTADGLWALPQYQYLDVLYYNKDLFAQANLPAPQAGWRWEDLLAAATQVAAQDGLSGEPYGWLEQGDEIVLLLSVLPLSATDLSEQPAGAVSIDRPEVAAALERMQTLVDQRALFWYPAWAATQPTPEPNTALSTDQLILDGRVGLWSSNNRPVTDPPDGQDGPAAWTPLPFELGVVPYPESSMPLGSAHGYAISGGTAHPQEAWRWIEFLSRQPAPMQNLWSPALPARRSVATSAQFGETLDPATWAAYAWALEHAPSFSLADMPTLWATQVLLGDALTQVLDHNVAADRALRDAQAQLPAILAAQSTPAPEDLLLVTVATPPPQTAPPGTTLVRFGAPQHQVQTFQPLVNAFQSQHPEILVVVQPLEQGGLAANAQALDCLVWSGPPRTRADREALVDLQPLIDAAAQFPRDDYPAALLAPYYAEGRLVGLPLAFALDVLYYQATAFAAAGLEPPTAQWTLADFLAAAQALTTDTGDQRTYGYATTQVLSDLFFFLNQFGARLVTGSGDDLRPNFDDPQVVAALQWYLDLSLVHQVMPAPEISYRQDAMRSGPSDTETLFQAGAVGMWRDEAQTTIPFPITLPLVGETPATPVIDQADAESFTIAMAPLPIGQAGLQASDLGPRDGLFITTQAPDPQACWTWLQFLAGSDALVGTDLSARRSMLTAPDFAARAPQAQAIVELYGPALTQSSLDGVTLQGLGPFEPYWLLQALDNVLQGQGTLEENLAVAQQISLNYLACLAQTPEQTPRQCALQADPDYQGFVAP